jgi:hypothetical protein
VSQLHSRLVPVAAQEMHPFQAFYRRRGLQTKIHVLGTASAGKGWVRVREKRTIEQSRHGGVLEAARHAVREAAKRQRSKCHGVLLEFWRGQLPRERRSRPHKRGQYILLHHSGLDMVRFTIARETYQSPMALLKGKLGWEWNERTMTPWGEERRGEAGRRMLDSNQVLRRYWIRRSLLVFSPATEG